MESLNFIEQLNELALNEDVFAVSTAINELRGKFDDFVLEEERKVQVAQQVAKENEEEEPVQEGDFGKDDFYAIFNVYKLKRKEAVDARKAIEDANLQSKKTLITKLTEVIQSEENIGSAFNSFKEIQIKWKEIGDIPRDKRSSIQAEYSKLIEDFYYNIKIYKDLKDHDFHRNTQLKDKVIEGLKALKDIKSIKELETQLKALQHDWDDIGPVQNEEWDRIKGSYWTEVRSVYERINRHYDDRRLKQQENLKLKEELIIETKSIIENAAEFDSISIWDSKTKEILALQAKWKTIGFGPKKENDAIWKTFRGLCDQYFEFKNNFFGKVNEKFDAIATQKEELIAKAIELNSSTDWKETSNKLIQLQKQWKQLGHAGRKNEQILWKKFRTACDSFFNARQSTFDEQDKAYEDNLTQKEAVLKEINEYKLSKDKEQSLKDLLEFSKKFNVIGRVPMKAKEKVFKAYKSAMDKQYGDMKLEGAEKDKVLFSAKIEMLKASPDASRLFNDMKFDLRKDIDKQQKEVNQLENNLGFFSSSKSANPLMLEVEGKISKAKEKVELIKTKLKMIPNE